MGGEDRRKERYSPRAGDLEGEPEEAFKLPPGPQKGRIEISEKQKPTKPEPEKKHWWQRG